MDRRRGHGRRQCPVPQGVATSAAVARILLPAPRSTFPPQIKFRRLFDNRSVAERLISVTENRNGNGASSKICSYTYVIRTPAHSLSSHRVRWPNDVCLLLTSPAARRVACERRNS